MTASVVLNGRDFDAECLRNCKASTFVWNPLTRASCIIKKRGYGSHCWKQKPTASNKMGVRTVQTVTQGTRLTYRKEGIEDNRAKEESIMLDSVQSDGTYLKS